MGGNKHTHTHTHTHTHREKAACKYNNIKSIFEIIISGVPHGSIVVSILFNIFLKFVASVHNFADYNTLSSFVKTMEHLIGILESERK